MIHTVDRVTGVQGTSIHNVKHDYDSIVIHGKNMVNENSRKEKKMALSLSLVWKLSWRSVVRRFVRSERSLVALHLTLRMTR